MSWRSFVNRSLTSLRPIARAGFRGKARRIRFESLETREMFSADVRSYDGSGNNLLHADWGSAGADFVRVAQAQYADGLSAPAGSGRLGAREISNVVAAQNGVDLVNDRNLSAMVYAWGQFIDHDIDLTGSSTTESLPISVPTGDAYFDPAAAGNQTIPFTRSTASSTAALGAPRQQVNDISAFLDGSQVYGFSAERAAAQRTFVGGFMKTSSGGLLPYNSGGLANQPGPSGAYFLAGDVRANENIELTSLQTLFVREHNRVALKLATDHPAWTDEQLYQQARRYVVAEMQAITYNEFLPALIGQNAMPVYRGYQPNVNPGISNEFATAGFRLGHSMLGSDVEFLDNNGVPIRDSLELRETFFQPSVIAAQGIDPILKYLASDRAQQVDVKIVDEVRNFLFGAPGSGGLDLAAANIQRGRDHGLADYNSVRAAYGLPKVVTFEDITKDPALQAELKAAYGNVNNIDLWVGALAEDHLPCASVGALTQRMLVDQFSRLRVGDRFYYENDFLGRELDQLRQTRLSDLIARDTNVNNLQPNAFVFDVSISGRVFADANGDGKAASSERPLAGITVTLQNASGAVIATAKTDATGVYFFSGLDLATYRVRIDTLPGAKQTSQNPTDIAISRGAKIDRVDFGIQMLNAPPPTLPVPPMPPLPSGPSRPERPRSEPPRTETARQRPTNMLWQEMPRAEAPLSNPKPTMDSASARR